MLNENRGSLIRSLIRTGLVVLTTFGFDLSPEQIGGIQVFAEAVIQAAVQWNKRV